MAFERSTKQSERSGLMTGMFRDREGAERAYDAIISRGYVPDDVIVIISNEGRLRHFGEDAETSKLGSKAAKGAGVGAAVGGGLGALLAALAAAGVIALPGIGVIALGPIAAALAGGAAGAVGGGLVGALIGAGIPEDRAKLYDKGIREGNIVMGVTPRSDVDAEYFAREWQGCRAEQVYRPSQREAA